MKYLSNYLQDKQTKVYDSTGAFFAFNEEQFAKEQKDGVTYAHVGFGLYCPKDNVKPLTDGLEKALQDAMREDVKDNGAEGIMRREYFNYESQLCGDDTDALNALSAYQKAFPDLFTEELINKVFSDSYKEAIEKDWF